MQQRNVTQLPTCCPFSMKLAFFKPTTTENGAWDCVWLCPSVLFLSVSLLHNCNLFLSGVASQCVIIIVPIPSENVSFKFVPLVQGRLKEVLLCVRIHLQIPTWKVCLLHMQGFILMCMFQSRYALLLVSGHLRQLILRVNKGNVFELVGVFVFVQLALEFEPLY